MRLILLFACLSAFQIFSQKEVQCGEETEILEGVLSNTSSSYPNFTQNKGMKPSVGAKGELLKPFEKSLFGGIMTGTLVIAKVEIVSFSGSEVKLKVLETMSNIVVNGKKKNHFVKGTPAVLKIYSYEKPHLKELKWANGGLKAKGLEVCGRKTGEWMYYNEEGVLISKYTLNEDQKKDGTYIGFHSNGAIAVKGAFNDGDTIGEWKEFYEDSKLFATKNYSFGKQSGNFSIFYPDGSKKVEGAIDFGDKIKYLNAFYLNGNKKVIYNSSDRIWKEWYEAGQLKSEGKLDYSERKEGLWKEFYEDGKPKSEIFYDDDKYEGIYKTWFPNGQLQEERNYYWTGEKEGVWKVYNENGKAISQLTYKMGKRDGEYFLTYDSGSVKEKGSYRADKLYGKYETFYQNGNPKILGEYDINGLKTGTWLEYFEVGGVEKSFGFKADVHFGPYIIYSAPGIVLEKGSLNDQLQVGTFEHYYPSGKLLEIGNFDELGTKSGLWERYFEDGKIKEKGNYTNGVKSGKWLEMDENGKKKKVKY